MGCGKAIGEIMEERTFSRGGNEMRCRIILLWIFLGLMSGCSWVSVDSTPYAGEPKYPATDPASVEILRADPARPFYRLGEIHVDFTGNPPEPATAEKIRKVAAKWGADAVILSGDTGLPRRSWWDQLINPDPDQVISGVAIRYAR